MTLYELCQEWAKLAPDECTASNNDVIIWDRTGASTLIPYLGKRGMPNYGIAMLFDAVCRALEKRQIVEDPDEKLTEFSVVYQEQTYVGDVAVYRPDKATDFYESGLYTNAAQALLDAYVQYLKGQT